MNAHVRHEKFWRAVAEAAGHAPDTEDIMPIVGYHHPILDSLCDEVAPSSTVIRTLFKMYFTMLNANGAGLAAPQVGLTQRLVVIRADDEHFREDWEFTGGDPLLMINPRIVSASTEMMIWTNEACLSMPGFVGTTRRHRHVEVAYTDFYGREQRFRSKGVWMSACLQHEIQHLNGEMFWSKIPDIDGVTSLFEQRLEWAQKAQLLQYNKPAYPMAWKKEVDVPVPVPLILSAARD